MQIEIDCRGLACPLPVIRTKKALDEMDRGTVVTLVDNEPARENVSLFAKNCGFDVVVKKESNDLYAVTITKGDIEAGIEKKEEPMREGEPFPKKQAYLIASNLFGQGSPDLGQILMKSLFVSLLEGEKPDTMILVNTGVYLAAGDSPVLEQLKALEDCGVEIICCGTCLGYYKLTEKLALGRVGNMFEIKERLQQAGKVITIT